MKAIDKILNLFNGKKYDFNSIEGINSIPTKSFDIPNSGYAYDEICYILQRKATEFKKANRMDLAIACLRKSNEISNNADTPILMEKDYLRLVKYLKLNKQEELAVKEEQNIYLIHPEFLDKRIKNKKHLLECYNQCKNSHTDLCLLSTKSTCPICGKYNLKVFSISGRNGYEPFPIDFLESGGTCKNCIWNLTPYSNMKP